MRLLWRPPYDAEGLLAFLGMRAVPGVEEVFDGGYRRAVDGRVAEFLVAEDGWDLANRDLRSARALFDCDADPLIIKRGLGAEKPASGGAITPGYAGFAQLVAANPGRRIPGATSPAELAIRAVLGQQVSVAAARTVTGRLVAALGAPLREPEGSVTHAFPTSAALAEADPTTFPMPQARAATVVRLASALAEGLDLNDREALVALKGIGPWTADYIAFRALGDRDAWMPGDLGVRHALKRLGLTDADSERWRPYRAYAIVHLWASLVSDNSTVSRQTSSRM